MPKNMLLILGSPRPNGSCAAMLRCAAEASREAGWNTNIVNLYEMNIALCKGCRACKKTRLCVIDDDMRQLTELILQSERIALAAPTYWANVPAPVKAMFDRLFGVALEETKTFPRPLLDRSHEYLLLTACNTPAPFCSIFGQSTGTLRAMDEVFKTAGLKRLGSATFSNAHDKNQLPRALEARIRRLCH